jgi:hypothetical protein
MASAGARAYKGSLRNFNEQWASQIRAENGPKFFGPARPGPSFFGPARSGPENFGNFLYNVRASFFTCLFFTVISVFRDIFTALSMFL